MRKLPLPLLAILFFTSCQKQDRLNEKSVQEVGTVIVKCGSDEALQMEINKDPQRGIYLDELNRKSELYKGRGLENGARLTGTRYVSVVVHIVLADPNFISPNHVQSQIDALNRDYKKANSELVPGRYLAGYDLNLVANCDIEFVLSQTERKQTPINTYFFNDGTNYVKKTANGGLDPISPETKLNIWVCDLRSKKPNENLAGYAQRPGGDILTDGVVLNYGAFGVTGTTVGYPFIEGLDLGRVATHEVGHWLNLYHIFGDEKKRCTDDFIDDTPKHEKANYDFGVDYATTSCKQDPRFFPNKVTYTYWMNYMDYSYDRYRYMFTDRQKLWMDAAIGDHGLPGKNGRFAYFSDSPPNPTVTDIDGNVYNTITIGTQVWMKENLKTTHYRNGAPINNVTDPTAWSALTTGAWCNYNNDPANNAVYGKLYNWFAASDARGLAPTGWHVPTFEEWNTLSTYLGGDAVAGGKMKSTGTIEAGTGLWYYSPLPPAATNSSGFTGLPGGTRNYDGTFGNPTGYIGFWWSYTESSSNEAWERSVEYDDVELRGGNFGNYKPYGFSVRCIKD